MCPECSAESRKNAVIQERTCIDCGTHFQGGPRARRCPICREIERLRYSRNRKKTIRPLGSIDICPVCKQEYSVISGRQKYCSDDCQRVAVLEWQRIHKKEYAKKPEVKMAKTKRKAERQKTCAYCLCSFWSSTPTNYCSEYCRKQQNRIQQYQSEIKRGVNCDIQKLEKEREEYRKQNS